MSAPSTEQITRISIHALREEGDAKHSRTMSRLVDF